MAKKEKIHDNKIVQEALKSITLTSLSTEARDVMRNLIQESNFLGKNRVPEKDVYYIVKNAPEISETMVAEHLKLYRQINGQNYPSSKSAIEKYKRICTLISQAFEQLLNDGSTMNGLKKYVKKKPLTAEQVLEIKDLLDSGIDAQAVIDLVAKMK
ncbi:hypothetical protein [Serratia inhibens]|uniref:hypothetical protein n=1 Tax=Serratia inhibens TaxID=2338073 RepID=UPI00025E245B|nr:hypothetical protein [Serratia inhibens]ANS42650.1 hypothetical protein Q5A_010950 [Serratia inhibens PRI-2C]